MDVAATQYSPAVEHRRPGTPLVRCWNGMGERFRLSEDLSEEATDWANLNPINAAVKMPPAHLRALEVPMDDHE
jgi:hypothetical protein